MYTHDRCENEKKMRLIAGSASTHDCDDMHVGDTAVLRPKNGEGGRFVLHMASAPHNDART